MTLQSTALHWIKLWHLIGALMVGFIIYTSLAPHPILPMTQKWSDKLYHFTGYFGVMAWYAQFVKQRFVTMVLLVVLGVSLEFAQLLVNTRSFEWADMLANILGVILATMIVRGVLVQLLTYFENRCLKLFE